MDINLLTAEEEAALRTVIAEANNIVITCHKSPDGDALGSSLAWAEYLRTQGKEPAIVVPDAYPDFLFWLPGSETLVRYDKHTEKAEAMLHDADLIFFDIEMPGLSGMDVAKKVREYDKHTTIVFVTNLAQYAIEGYSVNAFDFLLKPINYSSFELKLDRVFHELHHHMDENFITIGNKQGITRLNVNDILYVEVKNHDLIYHSLKEEYRIRSTMLKAVEELSQYHFELCNACYLVNLKYVNRIENNMVEIGESKLMISQSRRKTFLSSFAKYLGGTE